MKIVYIANHDQACSNDDEGSIAFALKALGHDVVCLREENGYTAKRHRDANLVLFHKWTDFESMGRLRIPKVFWFFDLVDWPDPTLARRCQVRKDWMARVIPAADLGFCTDGDWVARDTSGKLHWLTQGADERMVGRGEPSMVRHPILFTGISRNGGTARESFVAEMRERWGDRFHHVPHGVHGAELRNLVALSDVVVCPDSPVTDRYFSNRVYLMLGFGAFLIHPRVQGICDQFDVGGKGVAPPFLCYQNRQWLHETIADYLQLASSRELVAAEGLRQVKKSHLYRHRCAELLRIVKERLGVG